MYLKITVNVRSTKLPFIRMNFQLSTDVYTIFNPGGMKDERRKSLKQVQEK